MSHYACNLSCAPYSYDGVWVFTKEDYFYINIEPVSAKVINLLEQGDEEIECRGKEIRFEVKPFEIVSMKLQF